jgi:hypothetical protein
VTRPIVHSVALGLQRQVLAALLAVSAASVGYAAPTTLRTDCVGYYRLQLPGDIEYAVHQPDPVFAHPNIRYTNVPVERSIFRDVINAEFEDGLGVWGTNVTTTSKTTQAELEILANSRNYEGQKTKDELLAQAEKLDDSPLTKKLLISDAATIRSYKPFNNGTVYALQANETIDILALIGNRIVSGYRDLQGTPQKTIDAFLKARRPREPFEVPNEPGSCLAYQFWPNESEPVGVGVSIRLKDRPDIVIYLRDQPVDKSEQAPANAQAFINKAIHPGNSFYASESTAPLDGRLRSLDKVTIDGRKGVGVFALVTRKRMGGNEAVHNEANKDQDWAYIAYVPGDKKAPPGASSDLTFRVERFGRFAKQPMTEKEFRALVKTIGDSIKRRPGAWQQR